MRSELRVELHVGDVIDELMAGDRDSARIGLRTIALPRHLPAVVCRILDMKLVLIPGILVSLNTMGDIMILINLTSIQGSGLSDQLDAVHECFNIEKYQQSRDLDQIGRLDLGREKMKSISDPHIYIALGKRFLSDTASKAMRFNATTGRIVFPS